jgi:opacity protein-like surface antigen
MVSAGFTQCFNPAQNLLYSCNSFELTHFCHFLARLGPHREARVITIKRDGLCNEVSKMNKFKTVLLVGVLSLPMVAMAQAADQDAPIPSEASTMTGFYLRGDVGASFLDWTGGDNDTTFVVGGGVGYQFSDFLRADVTVDTTGDYTVAPGSTINTTAVLGNVYFDWKNDSAFTPYVGAGIGYGWISGPVFPGNEGLALGLAAGVSVDMTSNLAVDVGYRFRDIGSTAPNTREHQVTAGMRFKF